MDRMPQSMLTALARRWWVPAVMVAVGLVAAYVWTARQTAVYRASALLVVVPDGQIEADGDILRSLDALERRTLLATFARLPSTREQRRAAAQVLQRRPEALSAFRVGAAVVPNTNLIRIDVDGPDPAVASQLANTAGDLTAADVRALYRIYTMRPIAAAEPPPRPLYPDRRRNYVVSALLGLFVGMVAAVTVPHGPR
jgi:capsular polysaccharide biosynthesis protein